jgi:hypothetical protein
VYALGVMLFELLTGERPHKPRGDNPLALLQAITETDATAPSEGLRRRSGETASAGGVDLREARLIRGDLDTIVLKALSRDPARRYHSARAFADDLERFLEQRPIAACPDSAGYRIGKWMRRNRALATSLLVLTLTAVAAAGVTWHLARQNQLRTEQALRSAQAAQSLQRVLTGMFQEADLIRQDRAELSVDTLLAIAQARAERDLGGDPNLLIGVSSVLANGVFQVVDRERGADQLRALFERLQAGAAVDADTRVLRADALPRGGIDDRRHARGRLRSGPCWNGRCRRCRRTTSLLGVGAPFAAGADERQRGPGSRLSGTARAPGGGRRMPRCAAGR